MINVGIIGVTGYTGIELLRILHQHPEVVVTHVVTDSYVGEEIAHVYPHLHKHVQLLGEKLEVNVLTQGCDVIFIALPAGHAEKIVPQLLASGTKVIDLGADFRFSATYGLPEMGARTLIQEARLIANPGCYPTASILATLPALAAGIIELDQCIYDAKSGVSGAGRSLALRSHYCEVAENLMAYHLAGAHRHTPEIEQALSGIAKQDMVVQFSPHVVPMIRGLLVTAYFKLKTPLTQDEVYEIYHAAYQHEAFIRLRREIPQVKQVRGTNYCDMSVHVDVRTQRLIVVSVIDNLIKGAAGQAVQNMNLMYGLAETVGLDLAISLYP